MRNFGRYLIRWYENNMRPLPWRATKDPYKIWLSEVILQQTRVAQGLPYYERIIRKFPSLNQLAQAPQDEVLREWQGLGYYSRARNLHKCAQQVVEMHQGKFPRQYKELLSLPGIGPYTAAAIASIVGKEPVAVVDGNVMRVLARYFGISDNIAAQQTRKVFQEKANALIPHDAPDTFNQAIMEFGATHCTPHQPQCNTCPLAGQCVANKNDLQQVLPVKLNKLKKRIRHFYYFVVRKGNQVLMRQRQGKDIWHGLYEFYLIEASRPHRPGNLLAKEPALSGIEVVSHTPVYQHLLTHQTLKVTFVETVAPKGWKLPTGFKSVNQSQIASLPKPIIIDKYLKQTL